MSVVWIPFSSEIYEKSMPDLMAEKGPPKSWKSHDFPERFKTTSGTNFAKNEKQK